MTESTSDQYEVLEKIGHGSFGIIRKVRRKSDGIVLCRKEISYARMSKKERDQLAAEFNILSKLRHPNIVAYIHREHVQRSQDIYLYMEYCSNGDLGQVIRKLADRNIFADERYVWDIFAQIVCALYRCHNGVDPPEVGSNVLVPPKTGGLKSKQEHSVILHRDLKPENVFLGEDDSVKLGDFGLSKLMSSQDFASTYVGTPFYMSPEICAAERYTVHSDIWSLGCIMYELCMKTPPFNAKTHIQLIQRIKSGEYKPLPDFYSAELHHVIARCLSVNPRQRPDTTELLNLPIVRLMRKQRECIVMGRTLKSKEAAATKMLKEAEQMISQAHVQQERMHHEIESQLRREWEVKARLEINRQIQLEREKLAHEFASVVEKEVKVELQKLSIRSNMKNNRTTPQTSAFGTQSSSTTSTDTDLTSTTEPSEVSMESPELQPIKPAKKNTRTPLCRSKTTVESPIDVQMAEPSPMSIASLSLSPRRHASAAIGPKNLFFDHKMRWEPLADGSDLEEDDDDIPDLPSPSLPRTTKDPFKMPSRPNVFRQISAPIKKLQSQPNLFNVIDTKQHGQPKLPGVVTQSDVHTDNVEDQPPLSPNRRLMKVPSSTTLAGDSGSPLRRIQSKNNLNSKAQGSSNEGLYRTALNRNMGGRTLVELAQARAGGRQVDVNVDKKKQMSRRSTPNGENNFGASKAVDAEVVWDPMVDEMPSPFLIRGAKGLR